MENNLEMLAQAPYEEELIEVLRNEFYYGIPLSIFMLCNKLCFHQCHYLSIQLTRKMSDFKIVNANINKLDKEEEGNHSWVEKDDWVYDVTDGFKWKKEVYYQLYQPEIVSIYDDITCLNWELYNQEIKSVKTNRNNFDSELMLEMIEVIEKECPSFEHERLIKEIENFRNREFLTKKYYDKYVKKMVKSFFRIY